MLQKAWQETGKPQFMKVMEKAAREDLSELLNQGSYRNIWQKAFDIKEKKDKVLICADERVMPGKNEFKIGIAGQLILASDKDKNSFIQRWKGKVKAVRSHEGCGAAAVAWNELSEEEKESFLPSSGFDQRIQKKGLKSFPDYPIPSTRSGAGNDKNIADMLDISDLYGAVHSSDLAKALEANFEHLGYKKMRGNDHFHDARMIFWSADPTFDPSALLGMTKEALLGMTNKLVDRFLPPHFLSNGLAFGLGERYCLKELRILSGIALGDHGFGKLFNAENPFYVVSVGKSIEEAEKMNEKAKEALKEFRERVEFRYFSNK